MDYFLLTDNLTKATGKLDNLTNGNYFCQSLPITSWDINLPALKDGAYMFDKCASLMNFTADLHSLMTGGYMFSGCTSLTSFTGDLRALSEGVYMFSGCTSLTSFTSDLSALTCGLYMFSSCKLDLASVQNIAKTIKNMQGQQNFMTIIHIGTQSALKDNEELADALAMIRYKGWTVMVQYN